jgi:hypothetical protein
MQKRLRRDASDVQADATESLVALHQRDPQAKIGCPKRRRVATNPGAEYYDLEFAVSGRNPISTARLALRGYLNAGAAIMHIAAL